MHSSHIQFFSFSDSIWNERYVYVRKTLKDYRTAISSLSMKVSILYIIPCGCYISPNEQKWMYELCTIAQIWSHYYYYIAH